METKKGNLVWKVLIIAMCGIILLGLGKPATDNVKDLLGNKDSQTEESVESPGESAVTGSDKAEGVESIENSNGNTNTPDLLKGVWYWSDITIIENDINVNVRFKSDEVTYDRLKIATSYTNGNYVKREIYYCVGNNETLVGDWDSNITELDFDNENHYKIDILDNLADVTNGAELLELLQACAY